MPPIQLTTHEQFEDLWFARKSETPLFLIWFTADEVAPSYHMDKKSLFAAAAISRIPIYICNATINTHTPAYCKIHSYPTYMLCTPQKQLARIASTDIYRVSMWIASEVINARARLV